MSTYLSKNIPDYPNPVEFTITEVTHVTNKTNLEKIWASKGFKAFKDCDEFTLSWWSLKIGANEIGEAEKGYLESVFPDRTQQQIEKQKLFLNEFTTSLSFNNNVSRYGNFQFTFPLTELMEEYKRQICGGEDPVCRVYQTKLYKKEIVYVILIHKPQLNEKFEDYPELTSTSSTLVSYKSGEILWKAQAMCQSLKKRLKLDQETKMATTTTLPREEYYVWDHVSLAFHLNEGKILQFTKERLRKSLTCCNNDSINLSRGENCRTLNEAEETVKKICVI